MRSLKFAAGCVLIALAIGARADLTPDWARQQNKLGVGLYQQARQAEGTNAVQLLAGAVTAYRAALQVRTQVAFPQDWALTQDNLGNALRREAALSEGSDAIRLLDQAAAEEALRKLNP